MAKGDVARGMGAAGRGFGAAFGQSGQGMNRFGQMRRPIGMGFGQMGQQPGMRFGQQGGDQSGIANQSSGGFNLGQMTGGNTGISGGLFGPGGRYAPNQPKAPWTPTPMSPEQMENEQRRIEGGMTGQNMGPLMGQDLGIGPSGNADFGMPGSNMIPFSQMGSRKMFF